MISFGPVESKSNGYFIRCYHIAKSLAKLNHKVLVMEFPEEKLPNLMYCEDGIIFVHLRGNEVSHNRMLKNVLTFDPFHSIKFQLYSLIELIRFKDYLKDSDCVFVEGALMLFGIILVKIFKKKVILDTHCVSKLLALHFKDRNFWVYFARKILWDLLERFATKLSDIVIVVSERERDFVQTEYKIPESKIFVVPNVIQIRRRSHSKEELINLRKKWNLENKIIITFIGDLESVQNKDAVEWIINDQAPFFWEKMKDAVFLIIGKGEENFKCALSNVIFTGFVEDIASFLEISDVCIAPLRVGSGTKTKILTYMAYGKPVLTTLVGVEGLNLDDLDSVRTCKLQDFASYLLDMLENIDFYRGCENVRVIRENFSPELIRHKLRDLIKHAQL